MKNPRLTNKMGQEKKMQISKKKFPTCIFTITVPKTTFFKKLIVKD